MQGEMIEARSYSGFLGEMVKIPYNECGISKVIKGTLVDVGERRVTIQGRLGTMVLNAKNIEKMSKAN